jgi:hypothetical protein
MNEPIWISESNRPEQRVAFIAAICYCVAVFLDIFKMRIPFLFFEINIVVVGIGYLISTYKSNTKFQYISIGILWILVGVSIGVSFEQKFLGIPIAILGSHTGYFLIMCLIAVNVIQRRSEYLTYSIYMFCVTFAISMALAQLTAFLGVSTRLNYLNFPHFFYRIGNVVIRLASFSVLEGFSMLVVVSSLVFQAPKLELFYDDGEDETGELEI